MFSVHITQEKKLKNATITVYFGPVSEETSEREITRLLQCHPFQKALFSKCFSSTLRSKPVFLNSFSFKSVFSGGIRGEGRPNRRNIACSYFFS